MMTEPPPPPEPLPIPAEAEVPAHLPMEQRADGTLVIDLIALAPPPAPVDCVPDAPDPFNPEIVVCYTSSPSPRLGPTIGPVDDGFASAIPRARIKLSDTASAEANVHNTPVGGFNANGGAVKLKIDF